MEGWQSTPVVNIFKQCDVESKKNVELSGKVGLRMDEVIHKKVFRIVGSIPAVNFLKVPKDKPLGLPGRFLYLQVKFEPGAPLFAVHTKCLTSDGNTCRVSVGNIFKAENLKKKAGCVQLSLPDPPEGWTLLSLDLKAAVAAGGAGASPFKALKSIQLCSTITVRGAFSSDVRFGLQTLPREMVLSHSLDPSQLRQIWSPAEPTDVPEPVHVNKPILPKKKVSVIPRRHPTPRADTAAAPGSDQSPAPTRVPAGSHSAGVRALSGELSGLSLTPEASAVSSCRSGGSAVTAAMAAAAAAPRMLLPDPYVELQRVNGFTGEYCQSVLYNSATDELFFPAGALVIALAAGNSSTAAEAAAQGADESSKQHQERRQRFFIGHSAFVSCMALGGKGMLLATGQEGKQPLIRLWDCSKQGASRCLAILCAHASNLAALDVSADGRALVACGADNLARQTIALWDIRNVRATGKAQLLVRTVTSYHVRVLKFSPFEPDHFVSAGRDSIRCYRMKGEEIRGISIKMQAPLNASGLVVGGAAASVVTGPKVFTDIAFEASSSGLQLQTQHIYVATAAGAVFQVDYGRRALTAVYQLHAAAINGLSIGEGLALTASDDTTLRLWPLDFSSYLLEAQHEAPVTSACLGSSDGLLLVAGCEDGSLGQLDVVSRQHTSLLRSHCGAVLSMEAHPARPEYVTVSTDGSVRIWDATTHQQLFEFGRGSHSLGSSSSSAAPCCASCAAFSPTGYQLAVGFNEGMVRLFDIATSQLLQERQQHVGPITQLTFTPEGSRLLSCGADGRVVVYAVHHGCLPVKALHNPPPRTATTPAGSSTGGGGGGTPGSKNKGSTSSSSRVCAAVNCDGSWIAVGQPAAGQGAVGPDGSSGCAALVLFDAGLEAVMQVESAATSFERIQFSPDGTCLWALATLPQPDGGSSTDAPPTTQRADNSSSSSDAGMSCLLCFSVADGSLLQQLQQPHGTSAVRHFCLDGAGAVMATCGTDQLLKLWSVGVCAGVPVCQSFTAHHGALSGAAFVGNQLLSVGADGNICIWGLSAPTSSTAVGSSLMSNRAEHEAAAAAGRGRDRAGGQLQQQHLQRLQEDKESQGVSSLRSWLEPRRLAGGAAAVAGGVAVPQQQPMLVDEGIQPSPLFAEHAVQQQAAAAAAAAAPSAASYSRSVTRRTIDPLLSCDAVLGLDASRCGVLWLKRAGLLAYPAANTLVLFDLATKQQSLLSHHRQGIGALAVSSDGGLLATGSIAPEPAGGYADVAVWDVQRRCLVMLLQQHPVCVEQLAFSPDGCWLVSVGSGRVVVWDIATGRATAVGAVKHGVTGVAWLPHKPLPTFVSCGGDGLLLWSLTPNFLEQRQLDIPDIALSVSASAASAGSAAVDSKQPGCQITAVCTAASSGSCDIDSLAVPNAAGRGGVVEGDPVLQRQKRDAAAVTVFAADSAGGVWQLALGEGRLCGCVKVTTLAPGESAAALQWSQAADALAVGTSSGRLLRFTCSSSGGDGSGMAAARRGGGLSTGVEAAVTPVQAARQWWTAAGAAAAVGGSSLHANAGWLPCWTECSNSSISSSVHPPQDPIMLDGPIKHLCLEPHGLSEGVVTAGAASAWYVDLQLQQKAPLLAGHSAPVTTLLPVGSGSLVATLGSDSRLAVWRTAAIGDSTSSSREGGSRGMAQVPLVEWHCQPESPPTAAVFLPQITACVLGHADGRIALLELPALQSSRGADSSTSSRSGGDKAGGGGVGVGGVLLWCVMRQPSAVVGLALHPDQPLVMAASRDGLITTTHTDCGRLLATCKDLTGTVNPLHDFVVNPSGAAATGTQPGAAGRSCVAAAAWSDRLLVFRAPWQADMAPVLCSYKCPQAPDNPAVGLQSRVSFIPGSSSLLLFVSPCLGPNALLFDFTAGQPLRQLALTSQPTSLDVAPAGQLFAFGLADGCVLLTDAAAESSLELRACGGSAVAAVGGGGSKVAVQAVGFAQGGSKLLAAVGGVVTCWDA